MEHTTVYFHLYACPAGQRAAAAAALDDMDLRFEYEADEIAAGDGLSLTRPYYADDYPLYFLADCARTVREAAPGCSYVAWEQPDPDGLGELHAYTPVFGAFSARSAGAGEAVITSAQVMRALWGTGQPGRFRRLMPARRSRVAAQLHRAMGGPWLDDWAGHRDAPLHAARAGNPIVSCASGTPRTYTWQEGGQEDSGTLADYARAFARVKDASHPDTGLGEELRAGTTVYAITAEGLEVRPDENGYWPVRLSVPGEEATVLVWG